MAKVLEETSVDPAVRQENLNMVKMVCYLICQFLEMYEDSQQEASQVITTGKVRIDGGGE